MTTSFRLTPSLPGLCSALLLGLSLASPAGELKGFADFRERVALPPTAHLEVELADVTAADQPPTQVASVHVAKLGLPPLPFTLTFDDAVIDPAQHYTLRARILDNDKVLFETTGPIASPGHGQAPVRLQLRMSSAAAQASAAIIAGLPATFVGTLSCAACDGVQHHLNLLPNRTWYLRQTWVGSRETPSVDQLGRWTLDDEQHALKLSGAGEAPMLLAIGHADGLLKLDIVGQFRESGTDQELRRAKQFEPFDYHGLMRGLYVENDAGASFTECLTAQRWTVSENSEQRALHAAYNRLKIPAGRAALASLDGVLHHLPGKAEGTLEIAEYDGLWPAETCAHSRTPPLLEGTYWRLTRLDGKGVMPGPVEHEARLMLKAPNQFTASGGCNELTGRYVLKRGALTFNKVSPGHMSCLDTRSVESAVIIALKTTTTWSIEGQYLQLFDEVGRQVARFEAVYLH